MVHINGLGCTRHLYQMKVYDSRHDAALGSVQNLSHIWSGDGFGLHDLWLIERSHVHVTFGGPSGAGDVAQSCCCQVEA